MKPSSCKRLWEVEAARDGRLSGADLRSFELHVGQCRTCAEERRELDRLGTALCAARATADEVALRRGRERLLADAHGNHHASRRRTRKASLLLAATVGGVLAVLAFIHRAPGGAPHVVDVVASSGARWEQRLSGGTEEVRLQEGVFSLAVHRKPSDPRVVIVVPDGSIEDIGTEFQVTVARGETRGVVVLQGAVMLKLAGREPLLLRTPSSWSKAPYERPTANVAPPPRSVADAREEVTPPSAAQPKKVPAPRRDTAPRPTTVLSGEDLAYLRIVALRREGRSDEARVAAAEYLHAFPGGFRRAEVLAFVRAGQ